MFNLHTHCQNENAIVNGYFDGFLATNQWVSLGIHPWHVSVNWQSVILDFQEYENLVAIGECGLDRLTSTPWSLQKDGDLWERFWAASLLRGPRMLKLTKVKGHTTLKDLVDGKITEEDRTGPEGQCGGVSPHRSGTCSTSKN